MVDHYFSQSLLVHQSFGEEMCHECHSSVPYHAHLPYTLFCDVPNQSLFPFLDVLVVFDV